MSINLTCFHSIKVQFNKSMLPTEIAFKLTSPKLQIQQKSQKFAIFGTQQGTRRSMQEQQKQQISQNLQIQQKIFSWFFFTVEI